MKKNSRFISKAAAAVLSVSMLASLAACGGNGSDGAKSEGGTDKVTIAMWNAPNSNPDIDQFTQCEKATGIEIEETVISESDYSSKLNQMVATGDSSIDVYIVWENDIKNFAEVGGIEPLDDYLADSSINTDDFIPAVAALTEGLGATYGLPWAASPEILYYNKDMFDAAGIEYPTADWSYDDFLAAAEALTVKNADGTTDIYGCALPNLQTWWAGIGTMGDKVYDPATGELVIGDGAVKFVSDCADMVKNGIMPEPSSDTTDLFGAGRAAMNWAGSWNNGTYAATEGLNWDVSCIPVDKVPYNTLHTGFYTINANSENKEAAWKVIEYLMGTEGQEIVTKQGSLVAVNSVIEKGLWKTETAKTVTNWDSMIEAMNTGVFGYTCLPSGVTGNAVNLFNSAVLGEITPEQAVEQAMTYAAETIGY